MMNNKLVPGILLSLFAFASCSRTTSHTVTPVTPDPAAGYTYSMSSIYNSLKNMPKTVKMDPAVGGTFIGNSGTVYTFPANAFQTLSGGAVVDSVTLELTEYIKRGDMIFSRVLPVSNGDALVSGGQLLINAKQGSSKLMLKPGFMYRADVPQLGAISTGMGFYYGQPITNLLVNLVNWIPASTIPVTAPTITYDGDTLVFRGDSVGYSAAGRALISPDYQTFTVTVNGATFDDSDHVQAFALYDNYRVVHPMTGRYHQKFTETHVPNVPMHFVVYTVYHGDFYAGISTTSVTPATNVNYTVNLSKVNPITFLSQVNAL